MRLMPLLVFLAKPKGRTDWEYGLWIIGDSQSWIAKTRSPNIRRA